MQPIGLRLALRTEGQWWVAYCAHQGTMEGAIEIGRVGMAVVANTGRREAFLKLMSDWMAEEIAHRVGRRPEMIQQPAPEIERGGNA